MNPPKHWQSPDERSQVPILLHSTASYKCASLALDGTVNQATSVGHNLTTRRHEKTDATQFSKECFICSCSLFYTFNVTVLSHSAYGTLLYHSPVSLSCVPLQCHSSFITRQHFLSHSSYITNYNTQPTSLITKRSTYINLVYHSALT